MGKAEFDPHTLILESIRFSIPDKKKKTNLIPSLGKNALTIEEA